jgi:hypothetical protein
MFIVGNRSGLAAAVCIINYQVFGEMTTVTVEIVLRKYFVLGKHG